MTASAAAAPGGRRAAGPATSTDRLQRLLALVPYVISREAVGLSETAAAFGVSERELVDDLNMLWCVELRTPDPYCPIDLSYEGGEIVISQAEQMERPLRLGVDEASALLVALRMLAEIGINGPAEGASHSDKTGDINTGADSTRGGAPDQGSALNRTIAKLEAAAGEAAALSAQVAVQVNQEAEPAVVARVREALDSGRRVHLSYYVPGRDELSERDVDPMRLLIVEGRSYLEGWCRRADGVRLFRLDRVVGIDVLATPAEVPQQAEPVDVDQGLFRPSPADLTVVMELGPPARWVTEYYPCEQVEDRGEGRLRVTLRTPDAGWVRRLALGLGEDGRVIEPAEIATAVRADAAAALAQYGDSPAGPAGNLPAPSGTSPVHTGGSHTSANVSQASGG
jgi:proteasome accessory factor C